MSEHHKPGITFKAQAAVSNGLVSFANQDEYFVEGVEYLIHATPVSYSGQNFGAGTEPSEPEPSA